MIGGRWNTYTGAVYTTATACLYQLQSAEAIFQYFVENEIQLFLYVYTMWDESLCIQCSVLVWRPPWSWTRHFRLGPIPTCPNRSFHNRWNVMFIYELLVYLLEFWFGVRSIGFPRNPHPVRSRAVFPVGLLRPAYWHSRYSRSSYTVVPSLSDEPICQLRRFRSRKTSIYIYMRWSEEGYTFSVFCNRFFLLV